MTYWKCELEAKIKKEFCIHPYLQTATSYYLDALVFGEKISETKGLLVVELPGKKWVGFKLTANAMDRLKAPPFPYGGALKLLDSVAVRMEFNPFEELNFMILHDVWQSLAMKLTDAIEKRAFEKVGRMNYGNCKCCNRQVLNDFDFTSIPAHRDCIAPAGDHDGSHYKRSPTEEPLRLNLPLGVQWKILDAPAPGL